MDWHTKNLEEVVIQLETSITDGLVEREASYRLESIGFNAIQEKNKKSFLKRFIAQFNDFMIIILIIAAFVSLAVSYINGTNEVIDPIIIMVIIILNALLGMFQESKAEKSIEALKKISEPTSKVIRDGKMKEIDTEKLVPGDIIIIETGSIIPADARLINSNNLKIEEAPLTGESLPIEKDSSFIGKKTTSIGSRINMVYASTTVSYGRGLALVTDTGMNTEVGKIANLIMEDEAPETPLQKKLSQTGKYLGIGALSICVLLFFIGILKGMAPFDIFMISVSLAVAAIPEGLPAIVTIILAIGVQRMSKKNAIIRKLPAVETLGSASVICSDKTGTLTQNKMTVVEVYNSKGNMDKNDSYLKTLVKYSNLCNNTNISIDNGRTVLIGEPTEKALINYGIKLKINKNELEKTMSRIAEIPFDSKRKLMTTVHKLSAGNYISITKGAPDILIDKCKFYYEDNKILDLTEKKKQKIMEYNTFLASKALRVIAIAYKNSDYRPLKETSEFLEKELIFSGLIGMIDPPRQEAKEAVELCKQAGIKTVMITGDHIITANAIAEKLGILTKDSLSMTGKELNEISQKDLISKIHNYSVFARVSPEHKVRIVKAFQSRGEVVAMTGDGVNDAPALKAADIGCAMGMGGTDVAKMASDMILTDDNFKTIVQAIKEGRGIYSNIKKSIHFLLSSNIGEIITIFIAILFGWNAPLLAVHLLWVNLVTDSLPAIALGLHPADKNVMNHKPYSNQKNLFSDGLWQTILLQGVMIGMLSLIAFGIGSIFFDAPNECIIGRTMAFATLSISQLVHAFNITSECSLLKTKLTDNIYLIYAFIIGLILQVSVISVPFLANIFKVTPLSLVQWLIVAILCIMPIILVELEKYFIKGYTS